MKFAPNQVEIMRKPFTLQRCALLLLAVVSRALAFNFPPHVATLSQSTAKARYVARTVCPGLQMANLGPTGDREDRSIGSEDREREAAAVFVNEREMLSEQGFPRRYKAKIVSSAQEFLTACISGRFHDASFADGFEFHGSHADKTLTTEDFFAGEALGHAEFYGFTVDPYEPMRVWFNARVSPVRGTQNRTAQSCSLTFDATGNVLLFTAHAIDLENGPKNLRNDPCSAPGKHLQSGEEGRNDAAGLLPKPKRGSPASTPPPPSLPRSASMKAESGEARAPAVSSANAAEGVEGAGHARQEQKALRRQLQLNTRQRAEIAQLAEQCANLQAQVALFENAEAQSSAGGTVERLKEACDEYEKKIVAYEEKLAAAVSLMDEAAARHEHVIGERDELARRLSSETQLRSDVTSRLREQVERLSVEEAELGRLASQVQNLEAERDASRVAQGQLQEKVVLLRRQLEEERQQRAARQRAAEGAAAQASAAEQRARTQQSVVKLLLWSAAAAFQSRPTKSPSEQLFKVLFSCLLVSQGLVAARSAAHGPPTAAASDQVQPSDVRNTIAPFTSQAPAPAARNSAAPAPASERRRYG